ncbi:pentapeptide repeat-containing protein [Paenibacillus sp. EZ-K15]|uniref:pentapeptide repeat-containing protein n=1 Tax=Paenibacillus sp. EZ-K15 TaxID=2044275 RepID=UPI000BF348C1|nr:pentapeptide repeat-containing protein [Paenibacillus sp. EZ-K15]
MSAKQWIARWDTEQTTEVNQALATVTGKQNVHKKERSFPSSPFGVTDAGHEDFRGVSLSEIIQYLDVQYVDLSFARFMDGTGLNSSRFAHCRFDGMKLGGSFVTRQFNHCSFRKTNLKNARMGERFEDCDFTGGNLSHAIARDAAFIRCNFANVNFRGAHLMYCLFEECSFEGAIFHNGSLSGSRFVGETDALPVWGNTIMEYVKINGEPFA